MILVVQRDGEDPCLLKGHSATIFFHTMKRLNGRVPVVGDSNGGIVVLSIEPNKPPLIKVRT